MKIIAQIVPYHPLPPEVNAAIEKLSGATFDSSAFAVLSGERWNRAGIFLAYALPCMAAGAGLVWLADRAGWTGIFTMPLYGFFPVIFTAIVCNLLRGKTFTQEDMRLGNAIARWEERGGRIREKPLETKS